MAMGRSRCLQPGFQGGHIASAGIGFQHVDPARVGHAHLINQHVLGQGDDHRSGPATHRDMEGAGDNLGNAGGIVDLGRPFGERPKAAR
jgi:hypothetical protein